MHKRLSHFRQLALFVAGGIVCALTDVGLMQLLIAAGVHFASATTAGFLAGLVVNYSFHTRVTFATAATPANFARYLCVVGLNYLLTLACVALSVALVGSALPGKLLSLPLVAASGFAFAKYWIFRPDRKGIHG
jgi:putative flippase GtrA